MQQFALSMIVAGGVCCNIWCCYRIWRYCNRPYRPSRIYLLRHGESEGNLDQNLFQFIPDHAIPLTMNGLLQAEQAGKKLKEMIGDKDVRFWVSPYQRTRQTFEMVAKSFDRDRITSREEPRLREQDWGNFQDCDIIEECRRLRSRFGSFFYRIPAGESGADVYDRVSNFLESLFRDFSSNPTPNVVIISHGLTCRLFLMRFLHWSFEKFERTHNLSNCQVLILERQKDNRFRLITPIEEDNQAVHDEWDQYAKLKSMMQSPKIAAARASTPFDISQTHISLKHRRLMSNMM